MIDLLLENAGNASILTLESYINFIGVFFSTILKDSSNIPSLIQGVGLAFVSIFLTAAVFIYITDKEEMQDWDRVIILNKLVKTDHWLFYLAPLFLSPFFWGMGPYINIIIIVSSIFGACHLLSQLKNIKEWICDIETGGGNNIGYRQKLREEFLSEETSVSKKIRIWASTWSKEGTNSFIESRFMKIFFERCVSLSENNEWENVKELLSNFNANIDKRGLKNLVNIEMGIKNLLKVAESAHKEKQKKKNEKNAELAMTSTQTSKLLNFFISKSLEEDFGYISLFEALKEHLNRKEYEYKKFIFREIHQTLFEKIPDSREVYTIWDLYFPPEWKITESNLENEDVPPILFDLFMEWARKRFSYSINKKGYRDTALDEISRNLFPDIIPDWWAEIVTYMIRSRSYGDDKIIDLFNSQPSFGFLNHEFGPVEITSEQDSKKFEEDSERFYEAEAKNAIAMAVNHLGKYIPEKEIEENIQYLKKLKPKEEEKKRRKRKLLMIFEKLLTEIKSQTEEQSE